VAVQNIKTTRTSPAGLPYIIKQALGNTVGNVFLSCRDRDLGMHAGLIGVCIRCVRDGA